MCIVQQRNAGVVKPSDSQELLNCQIAVKQRPNVKLLGEILCDSTNPGFIHLIYADGLIKALLDQHQWLLLVTHMREVSITFPKKRI